MIKKVSRVEFLQLKLSDEDIQKDPFLQLDRWWHDALAADVHLMDAMHLSTVDEDNHADARIVLLKSFDNSGLVFYTNYESRKAVQLDNNPHACLVLFWPKVERQIRIRGVVKKTTPKESDDYFATRPQGAQIGAWASPQSRTTTRDVLEQAFRDLSERFSNKPVPRPPHWGGYRLVPNYFEFWQGRSNRLHDRICFKLLKDSCWQIERLAP